MHDPHFPSEPWAHRPSSEREQGVKHAQLLRLPNMRVAPEEGRRLRRALVAAHIELALAPDGPAIHEGLIESVRDHLAGRAAVVWQEQDRFKMSCGAFNHEERQDVEELAESLARALGAKVVFATTHGMAAAEERQFPPLVLLTPGVSRLE